MLQGQVSGTFAGSGTNWGDAANWAGAKMPGSTAGDTALFNAASNSSLANKTISLGSARTIGTLNVIGPNSVDLARSLTIGSAASPSLIFDNGASSAVINLSGGLNLKFGADIIANSNLVINNNSAVLGKISILGALNAGSKSITFYNDTSSADITVSGALAAGSIIKNGEGKLIFNSASPASITGPIALNNGAIVIGGDNVLGSGVFTLGANGNEKMISLSGSISRTLSNSLDISASDLVVSREDIHTAEGLSTLTFDPATASLTSIGAGARTITVNAFTGLAFGANQSFSGGTLVKEGSGVLTLGGANSTFSVLDVRAGTVVGYIGGTPVNIGGGSGLFGSGTIRVDGGNTVLEVRGASASDTLNIINGAHISLTDEATFRLTNATLGLMGGVIDLGSSGIFDYQGSVILGSTSILGAPAAGFDFAGNVAFDATHTGIADNASYRINLAGTGTQVISRTAGGAVTVSGTLVKNGSGEVVLDSSITSFNTTNDFQLANGMLTLTQAGQLASTATLAFSGSSASLNIGGHNQVLGGVKVGSGAAALIYMGGAADTATSLNLGALSFGNTTSVLRIRDYTDGTLLAGAHDIVTASNGASLTSELGQIWFYGYNKGASWNGSELTPGSGLLDSNWVGAASGNLRWFDPANWELNDEYAIPNSPGATARIISANIPGGFPSYTTINLDGNTVTLGHIYYNGIPRSRITNGTIVFDTGVSGSNATYYTNSTQDMFSTTSSALKVILKSNLEFTGPNTVFIYSPITGTGGIILKNGNLRFYAASSNGSFSGGIDIYNSRSIGIEGANSTGYTTYSGLGSGTVTIHGTGGIYGMAVDGVHRNMVLINNPIAFDLVSGSATLNAYAIYLNGTSNIALSAGERVYINATDSTTSTSYASSNSVILGSNFSFTGAGGVTFSGTSHKRIYSGNNTFTGGLTLANGTLWVDAGSNNIVIGEVSPGNNYIGAGNVTLTGGSLWMSTSGSMLINGGTLNIARGTFGYAPAGGMWLNAGIITGTGTLRSDRDMIFNGGTLSPDVSLTFLGGVTSSVRATNNDIHAGVIKVNNVSKGESGTKILDASIKSLEATGRVSANMGSLVVSASNQLISPILSLNGGMLALADNVTNNTINALYLGSAGGMLSLGTDSGLEFLTTGTGANWSTTATLLLQNSNGVWTFNGNGSYVRFSNSSVQTYLTGTLLENIAFTGFENGARIESDGTYWYLIPDGDATNEWSGTGGNNNWSTDGNWLGDAPNATGASASFRNLDENISGKTILVDGEQTIGTLNVQASVTATIGGSGTLVFSNTGNANATITAAGNSKHFTATWRLNSNTDLRVTYPTYQSTVRLANSITGDGDLRIVGSGYSINAAGNNSAWTGNLIWDDTVRIRLDSGNQNVLTGSGTFFIGDAGSAKTYTIEAVGGARTLNLAGGWVLNGHLATGLQPNTSTYYNLTINGAGYLSTGQHTIISNWNASGTNPLLTFNGVISGPGGITTSGIGRLVFNASNTYTGDFVWDSGLAVTLGADDALGRGTFRINSSYDPKPIQYWSVTPAAGVKLSNPLVVSAGNHQIYLTGNPLWFDANSGDLGVSSTFTGTLGIRGGTIIFGKDHVIEGTGGFDNQGTGVASYQYWLGGENTFSGNFITNINTTSYTVIGASSTQDGGGVVTKGPIGTGALILNAQGLAVYSDTDLVTTQTLGNTILINTAYGLSYYGGRTIAALGTNHADTLVLSANTLGMRNGAETIFNITSGTLVVASKILDGSGTPYLLAKTGASVLELANTDNEISAGIDARAGTVLIRAASDNEQVGTGASAFGTGRLRTSTVTNTGNAGAFEVVAVDSGTVTLNGTDRIILNNNGQFRVTGNNATTVLASGAALTSTGAAGQEGSLVAGLFQTTNGTLGVKLNTVNWTLGAGTVTLARSNLLAGAQDIYFTDNSRLNINKTAQTINGAIHVSGSAIIDVSGGSAHNPVSILTGNISVNATDSLLTFLGWDADPITGLGSTLIRSSLVEGAVINGVKLGSNAATSVVVQRNDNGIRVLLPFDQIFVWNGTAGNSQWAMNNWMKQDGLHLPDAQPNAKGAYVTFNTELANLNGATITLPSSRYLNNLVFAGGSNTPYAIGGLGGASLVFQGLTADASGFIVQTGVSDVTINAGIQLEYDTTAGKGKNLSIEQNGAGWLIFNSKIEGPDSIVTVSGTGAGAVVFNAANMFSKGFVVESGEVHIGADRLNTGDGGPLGVGAIMVVGGTLRATDGAGNDANRTLINDIVFAGDLTVAGTGALSITGAGTIVADATVTVTEASGTFVLGSEGETLSGTNNLFFEGEGQTVVVSELDLGVVNVSGSLTELDGVISGTTKIIKTGTGTLLLLAENTHSGGVVMQGGITGINNNSALGTGTAMLGSGTLRLDANNLSLANNFSLDSTGEVNTQTHTGTLTGVISGAGNIAKAGTGVLTLTNAANTHSGTMLVQAGTLALVANNAAGASTIHVDSAARVDLSYTGSLANAVSGAGVLEINGDILVNGGAASNAFTGTWAVNDTMRITGSDALGTNSKIALPGLLQTTGTADITLNNALTGSGTVQFNGSGTHAFGSSVGSAFTGLVDAREGVFTWDTDASTALVNNATLKATGGRVDIAGGAQNAGTLVANGGTFAFTGTANVTDFAITADSAVHFDQDKLSAKSLLQQDDATTEILVVSANTWTGTIDDLRLVNNSGATLGASSTLAATSGTDALAIYSNTLATSDNKTLTLAYRLTELQLQAGKTLDLNGDTTTPDTGDELNALISGVGSLQISANNAITIKTAATHTGMTTTATGTLKAGAADLLATSAVLVNNAVFDANNLNQTLQNLQGSGTLLYGSGTLTLQSGSYAGLLDGTSLLDKTTDGTLTLSGSNTHSGTTRVSAGILRATNAGALGASALNIAAPATAELSAITGTLANTLAGSGTLRVVDNTSVSLTGNASAWSGVTNADSGRLYVNTTLGDSAARLNVYASATLSGTGNIYGHTVINGGVLAPGNSPGKLFFTGTLQLSNATFEYDLSNITNPGHIDQGALNINDRTDVTGDVILTGMSTINVLVALTPLAKGEYDLVYYTGTLIGDASNLKFGAMNGIAPTGTDAAKYLVSTGEDHYIKLLYDFGYFTYWDGGTGTNWNNNKVDGGSGTWYAPAGSMTYTAWSGSGGSPNGEWLDAGFAIFKGDAGTVTVDNSTGSGTIAFSGAQFKTDGYLLTGGTLTTGGTDAVVLNIDSAVSATIATTITGTHNVEKDGAGTLVLAGTNTYTGTTSIIGGALVTTNEHALGANAVNLAANATLRVASGSMTFATAITGGGLLEVDLASATDAFAFAATTGTAFTGTASFNNSAYLLNNNTLANATAKLNAGNTTTVATGTQHIGNLTASGGALGFTYATGTQADGIIRTGAFDAISGTVTVSNTNPSTGTTGLFASTLLQQDEGLSVRLLNATTVSNTNLTLAGGATTTADIRDGVVTTATATYTQALNYTGGLAVDYALTQLDLVASRTTTLSGDTTDTAAAELHAQITGAGNLAINATNAITLNNAANTYTGKTIVNTGTLVLGVDNALGNTSELTIASGAVVDTNGRAQTIRNTNPNTSIINGWLNIHDGSVIKYSGTGGTDNILLSIGHQSGASGTVTVSGNGSQLSLNESPSYIVNQFVIGNSGTGLLDIKQGGLVNISGANSSIIAGYTAGGVGTINVSGNGSELNTDNQMLLGFGANSAGHLNISDGAQMTTSSFLYIGKHATGTGAVMVTGPGSRLNAQGKTISVGDKGTGTLTIENSALVEAGTLRIGAAATANGTLNLDDGVLSLGSSLIKSSTATGTAFIDSGTLRASGAALTISGFAGDEFYIKNGGAWFDTNGARITGSSAIAGTGALNKVNTGTLTLSASNSYAGGTEINEGTLIMGNENALGSGTANIVADAELRISISNTVTLANALKGSGLLNINLNDADRTFDFGATGAAATGASFTGTVRLANATLNLGTDAAHTNNALALASSMLELRSGAILATNSETRHLGGLDMGAGSVTQIDMTAIVPTQVLQTGTLAVDSGAKIAFNGYTGTTPVISSTNPVNFLDQDGLTAHATLLIATDNLLTDNIHVAITQEDGVTPITFGQQIDYGAAIATYNYTALTGTQAQAHSGTVSGTAGLYYDYLLTTLDIKSGTTLVLDSTAATDKTLSALITGSGNLELVAGSGHIILSHSNSYTGTTTITSGTTILDATDALGQTAHLTVTDSAALDLGGHKQTITNGAQIDGGLYNSHTHAAITGSLGLGGLVSITSTNAGFAANVGVTGTTTINNTQALGNSGTANVTGELVLDSATGTLAKQVAGTGTVSLIASSSVALTGTNTLSGEWNIAQDTALRASSTANLGLADILLDGLLSFENAADETLANNLSGSGTFAKENTGNLTISHSNAFAGATQIDSGTLTLADLGGVGTSTVANNAILDLAGTGTFANTISGTGVNLVSGSVSLRGTNTAFTGTLRVTGTADITDNDQVGGATAHTVIASNAKLATTATSFIHDLTGDGILAINSVSGTFDFMATTGSAFAGTVTLDATALTLNTNHNTEALASATLQLNTGGILHSNGETRRIHGLTLNGGALWLPMNGVDPVEVLNVGTLSIADLGSTVVFENYTGGTTAIIDSTVQKNWLDQDNLTDNATLLVAADTLAEAAPRQIAIYKADGTALSNGQTIEHDEVYAIYNYTAQTTGSASAHTSGSLAPGLYYDYVLTELNVKQDKTLQLTDAGATDDTLSAAITGDGSVTFTTGSAMTLTGSNTYTGTSTLISGTVVAGVDNALGSTKLILVEIPATFDLNGKAQTIAEGGRIDGHLAGTGTLTLASGTLAINSANADYSAQTNIGAPATVHATDAGALGTSHVQLDGVLKVDATGTMQNTLAGSGQFHASSGDITLVNSSASFHGTGTVTSGRLTATEIDALGDAPIGVAAGAGFEQLNVTGTLQNALSGEGTHLVTNSTLRLNDPLNYTIASTTLDSNSALILEATGYAFGTLNMNNGVLAFANLADRARIATLGASTGNIVMNADLSALSEGINNAATIANYLDIANAGAGTHNVFIETNGTLPSALNASIELIGVDAASSATFTLANNAAGKLEYDLTVFELVRGDLSDYTPNANMWYLSDRNLSHAADAIINTASTLAIDWNYSLDSIHQRLGDIRLGLEHASLGSVWIKSRGYRLNATNELSGMSFRQYGWGVTGGADKSFGTQTGVSLLGGFIDAGGINREFDNNGNGHTTNVGIGAYLTLIKNNGWFADITARADRYSNRFEARSYDGTTTKGRYNNNALGLSLEAGRRLQRTDGWWIEPTVQMSVLWLDGASYTTEANATHRAMKVKINDSMNTQYRALLRFGRQIKDSRWHPYGKLAGVAVDSDRGAIKAHGKTFRTDYDGRRVEFGLGTSYRIDTASQLYIDYEYAKAQAYERPWSINLGYRRLW
ncbi:autotransporter-associated beta strand repeat-containing protein [Ereboglobus luteus]|nr:autotransporter-associated beta strand repeat-containing protein [Ereboglobus luteus]